MTETVTPLPETFVDLGVRDEIVTALADVGIEHPFPIQHLAIPLASAGTDMIGQARTGTGKTLAFGISVLEQIPMGAEDNPDGAPQALIMCPTRELALQVAKDFDIAGANLPVRVLTVYGGVGYEPQLDKLRAGVDVVVGTPGRLLDLANRRALRLGQVKILVLDEADEMLNLGFLPDVERLINKTPKKRQTLLFSATMPAAIVSLARMHMNQPINVRAEAASEQTTVPDTRQYIYQAHALDKAELLGKILHAPDCEKVMIFSKMKRTAQKICDELVDRGFKAAAIHGDLSQAVREKTLAKFRKSDINILVATDVAARGIDVTGVSHVINYECPDDHLAYVHRIGRTGRAGSKGVAITLVDWADISKWRIINKTLELDMPDPIETYSSSAHLFDELGIPADAPSRLRDPKPRKRPSDEEPKREPKRERPKRKKRNRRRTHHGVRDAQ